MDLLILFHFHFFSMFVIIFLIFFNFTILYWFCHISTWIRHRYTHVPHPDPSSLPVPSLWVFPAYQPQASSIMHRTWTGYSFHIWYYTCFNAILPNHPALSLSHRVQQTVLYICVSFAVSHTGVSLPSFGALGWPRGMVQGGRREGGSGWRTRVYLWRIHVDVWQNQYNIEK